MTPLSPLPPRLSSSAQDPFAAVRLPQPPLRPAVAIARRLAVAIGLVLFVTLLVWLDRRGYQDDSGRPVSLVTAFYYATVTATTTGYGDITPVTDRARLVTAVLVTPARVLFLIVLVGTTLELLTERWRTVTRLRQWRHGLRDHYIVCGYGTKGRSAIATLLGQGMGRDRIVVVDRNPTIVAEANADGLATVLGDASRTSILQQAQIGGASGVIISADRDDASVLITLTARELNRSATIVAAVREEENAHLLRQGGADSVITSAEASGRLLGLATRMPRVVEVIEDMLTVGQGLDIVERAVNSDEIGGPPAKAPGEIMVALIRDDRILRFDDPAVLQLQANDRLVVICAQV